MKHVKTILAASVLALSAGASASNMYIDLGSNTYDTSAPIGGSPNDADTTTGVFNEFGFSQILATSIYDYSDGSVFGSFFDSNIPSELTFAGIPTAGTALDGSTAVSLVLPNCAAGQCDIDALSPLVPPLVSDSEGFLQTWDLQAAYHFDGTLNAAGPVYTGGFLDIYFNDILNDANDRKVLTLTLTGSDIEAANLSLFFDITFAEDNWLYIEDANGNWVDANDGTVSGNYATADLDTNVDPPIPTPNQLLLVVDSGGNPNVIRQERLDGSITAAVPVPGTLALLGLGLMGVGAARRRRG